MSTISDSKYKKKNYELTEVDVSDIFIIIYNGLFCCNRLGFLVDFLSHAAIVGFVAGAAIVIGLQQLKGLFGITHFTTKTDIISVMKAVWEAFHNPVYILYYLLFFLIFTINSTYIIFIQKLNISFLQKELIYNFTFFISF
jgi:MFS superfamily sulfate permease-like transporter